MSSPDLLLKPSFAENIEISLPVFTMASSLAQPLTQHYFWCLLYHNYTFSFSFLCLPTLRKWTQAQIASWLACGKLLPATTTGITCSSHPACSCSCSRASHQLHPHTCALTHNAYRWRGGRCRVRTGSLGRTWVWAELLAAAEIPLLSPVLLQGSTCSSSSQLPQLSKHPVRNKMGTCLWPYPHNNSSASALAWNISGGSAPLHPTQLLTVLLGPAHRQLLVQLLSLCMPIHHRLHWKPPAKPISYVGEHTTSQKRGNRLPYRWSLQRQKEWDQGKNRGSMFTVENSIDPSL